MVEGIEIIFKMSYAAGYIYIQNATTLPSQFSFVIFGLTLNGFSLQNGLNQLITRTSGNYQHVSSPILKTWLPGAGSFGESLEESDEKPFWGAFLHFSWEQGLNSGYHPGSVSESCCRYGCTYLPHSNPDLQTWFSGLIPDLSWHYSIVW